MPCVPQWPFGETGIVGEGAALVELVISGMSLMLILILMLIDINMDIEVAISVAIAELLDVRLCGPSGLSGPIGVAVAVYVEYSGGALVDENTAGDDEAEGVMTRMPPTKRSPLLTTTKSAIAFLR